MGALANHNAGFLKRTAANELERKGLANRFGAKLPVNVFEPGDCMAREGHKNVADDNAGLVGWTFGLNLEDDGRGFVFAFQRFSQ